MPSLSSAQPLSLHALVAGLLMLLLIATGGCEAHTLSDEEMYENEILQHRLDRDMRMRDADRTVLDASTRRRFDGLRYYPVDPDYRFELTLERVEERDTLRVQQHKGEPVDKIIVGHVAIPLGDTTRLAAFRERGLDGKLWIPFRDPTNGDATYPAGRYLNAPLVNDSTVVVDFNKAFNPYCDYNLNYVCPLPPPENTLPVPVEAGEKKSQLHS
ncbi:MAG: DUF1684 domain-containing protein [Longimonas sp.]|uniref:DUF1684 domain-containing protein n=1 Tax=Longimonas sp. TaxID=2039626 RepID=UPI00335E2280